MQGWVTGVLIGRARAGVAEIGPDGGTLGNAPSSCAIVESHQREGHSSCGPGIYSYLSRHIYYVVYNGKCTTFH